MSTSEKEQILESEFEWSDTVFPSYDDPRGAYTKMDFDEFMDGLTEANQYAHELEDALDIYERILDEGMHKNGYETGVKNYLEDIGYEGDFDNPMETLEWFAEQIGTESANVRRTITRAGEPDISGFITAFDLHEGANNLDYESLEDARKDTRQKTEHIASLIPRIREADQKANEAVGDSFLGRFSIMIARRDEERAWSISPGIKESDVLKDLRSEE